MTVGTRFTSSPTGVPHRGSALTALFYWLFARPYGSQFVLRIEGTDPRRSTPRRRQAAELLDKYTAVGGS